MARKELGIAPLLLDLAPGAKDTADLLLVVRQARAGEDLADSLKRGRVLGAKRAKLGRARVHNQHLSRGVLFRREEGLQCGL